jgi:hydroxymethylbilane synthase
VTVRKLRVGTRGSKLALAQTRMVLDLLAEKSPEIEPVVIPIRTLGDRLPAKKRGETDGKGAFTGDIEERLAAGEIDIAVHSLKDLSVELGQGLKIGATPPRGDPRDALVSSDGEKFSELSKGAVVGTSSIRRKAQLLNRRSDLEVVDLHGNVETRVRKLSELRLGAIVLAAAGLDRLSMGEMVTERFPVSDVVPSAGQGTIAVEVRAGDRDVGRMVSLISDEKTMRASECERAFAKAIGGDCYVPAGAHATVNGRALTLVGMIASPHGRTLLKRTETSTDPVGLGESLAEELLRRGGKEFVIGGHIEA